MDEKLLRELHTLVGEALVEKIRNKTAEARDIANAIKFLKDNGIDCPPQFSKPLQTLHTELGDAFSGAEDKTLQ